MSLKSWGIKDHNALGGGVNPICEKQFGCIWTLFFSPLQRLVLQGDQVKRMANFSGEVMTECESERAPKHKHQPACATGEGRSADTLGKRSLEPRLRWDNLRRTVPPPGKKYFHPSPSLTRNFQIKEFYHFICGIRWSSKICCPCKNILARIVFYGFEH